MKPDTRIRGPWADKKLPNAYTGKDLPSQLYAWQKDVMERCMDEPDDRTINYIIDTRGNTGKSKFAKFMWFHHGALFLPWGRTGDILNYVCKNKDCGIYFFDLSRSKPQDWAKDDISAAVEQIKNGMIVNLKYETSGVTFDPPHVWIFSNQPPNLSSVSRDRWKLWEITNSRELAPLSIRRCQELYMGEQRPGSPTRSTTESSNSGTILLGRRSISLPNAVNVVGGDTSIYSSTNFYQA